MLIDINNFIRTNNDTTTLGDKRDEISAQNNQLQQQIDFNTRNINNKLNEQVYIGKFQVPSIISYMYYDYMTKYNKTDSKLEDIDQNIGRIYKSKFGNDINIPRLDSSITYAQLKKFFENPYNVKKILQNIDKISTTASTLETLSSNIKINNKSIDLLQKKIKDINAMTPTV